ncbi:methylated-DNA--[protein]-cysteine S-methyltransferase [Dysgonomonas sp. BGC7]|uniref:methylated-DNA--[protein]-cysteine S-methyltransferase n=1 Tax=Dysgonomonas sp. BGC7 TaxID=1658008 RepID=UPI000680A690|nr:methylated-DNA--[protein]-cysteine S-methyltransferase [Dysgonomonas sp. BGC7]MBD8388097.1 methylated-DNA--[protein]-cysteine S-methyltransferase [Dysgonomonas sp. BGC7]
MKAFLQSPVGIIKIEANNGYITSLTITEDTPKEESDSNDILNKAIKQLEEYFAGSRKQFELPIKQAGTPFQQKAWEYLNSIPYGETVSYKDEAIAIGSPKGCRAVGSANGRNNLAIIVPCHRVINENKGLGGYAYGLDVKRHLLELEQYYRNKP